MDLTNIKLNYQYTYTGLCLVLGEYPMGGNSRLVQFERWSKYFEWRTEGSTRARRFIVTKIYKQIPINPCYEIDGKIFNSLKEAEEYRKSL